MNTQIDIDARVGAMSAIFNNEDIMKKISNSATKEVDDFIHFMNNAVDDTLDEEALDCVAGGGGVTAVQIFTWSWKGVKAVAKYCWAAGRWAANNGW